MISSLGLEAAMNIGIHQIYYDPAQIAKLEPDFIPYDNTANTNREWAEYHVFETEFKKQTHTKFDYTGFVSWKFGQKSRIPGSRFVDFIRKHPGADVYFLNPFPMEELLFRNVWLQGDFYHPGILDFSQQLLKCAGYQIDLRSWNQPRESFAFCNYWVGNGRFWKAYMEFTGILAEILRTGLDATDKEFLHSIASKTNNFSYIAFIMERMFSTLLYLQPEISVTRFGYSDEEIRNRYPGYKSSAYRLLKKDSDALLPLRNVISWGIKRSRQGKELG
ncbi:MAG: hypothetical protein JNJ69_08425 [Leptospiraceae bacterium]|nr:hypothetical protein [Leptospiraceae bacterium]